MVAYWILALLQCVFAARVVVRLIRTARGTPLPAAGAAAPPGSVSIVVPVLNEERRLAPCLDRLVATGPEVREILVVDGGSTDGTRKIVASFAAEHPRVRAVSAAPVPPGWNGKAWGLDVGLRASSPQSTWILTVDADVRPQPVVVPAMVAHAERCNVAALSVATTQLLGDLGQGLAHPAMLATLVYRFGMPGHVATTPAGVQANGQCFLARRDVMLATDAFGGARASRCEDVTAARLLVRAGHRVGFYEAGDLALVRMHADWHETWANWPRSLTLRDGLVPRSTALGIAEIVLVQALPLIVVLLLALDGFTSPARRALFDVNAVLLLMRLGILAGTHRAYRNPPWTYWLSPGADVPVAAALILSALRRRHTWRGRALLISGRTT